MALIKRIRTLKDAGVLTNRTAKDSGGEFLRYNLIYGFNGSGKTTLSRLFSSLQEGTRSAGLPEGCAFEIELSDGTVLKTPDQLAGLQDKVCVFNTDFIERNLLWATGTAKSIFYISEEQAEAAAKLKKAEVDLPALATALAAAEQGLKDKSKILATFKTGHAKLIFAKLHIPNRKYEAPNLQSDFEKMKFDDGSLLEDKKMAEHEGIASRSSPPDKVLVLKAPISVIPTMFVNAHGAASENAGAAMVEDLVQNPSMVPWARTGYEYHVANSLKECLFCGETFSDKRRAALAASFNEALSKFIGNLEAGEASAITTLNTIAEVNNRAGGLVLLPELMPDLKAAAQALAGTVEELQALFIEIKRIYRERRAAPTSVLKAELPNEQDVAAFCQRLDTALSGVNAVIERHNLAVDEFDVHQQSSRDAIKRHFLSQGNDEYKANVTAVSEAEAARNAAQTAHSDIQTLIAALRAKVRTHGPAAEVISKLVKAYLGHAELSVHPAKEGYELHRHGKPVKGQPSEGEKTALALCYFLSTLESDGRKVSDLIVVIDDPVSSLDTKAMSYACALVLLHLRKAKQLILQTHNQHCMNEFKKSWRGMAYPENKDTKPTAAFLFLDVRVPAPDSPRSTTIVEMSKLLRAYDSEYHFLCSKVLAFEKAGEGYFEYSFLMPNVIRRVLELFLAFKVPGSDGLKGKVEKIAALHPELDTARLVALERLSNLESHSDAMEDFLSHSSMTIEEAKDANQALLELMAVADKNHADAIRSQCKAA